MNAPFAIKNLVLSEEAGCALQQLRITDAALLEILGPELDWFNLYSGRGLYMSKKLCQGIVATVKETLTQQDNQNIAQK